MSQQILNQADVRANQQPGKPALKMSQLEQEPNDNQQFNKKGLKFKGDVVVDTNSGLMWTINGNIPGKNMKWESAMNWVNKLKHGGYSDWRLPTYDELVSFVKRAGNRPEERFNISGFINIQPDFYWTSTEYFEGSIRSMNMRSGMAGPAQSRESYYYAWPVRKAK